MPVRRSLGPVKDVLPVGEATRKGTRPSPLLKEETRHHDNDKDKGISNNDKSGSATKYRGAVDAISEEKTDRRMKRKKEGSKQHKRAEAPAKQQEQTKGHGSVHDENGIPIENLKMVSEASEALDVHIAEEKAPMSRPPISPTSKAATAREIEMEARDTDVNLAKGSREQMQQEQLPCGRETRKSIAKKQSVLDQREMKEMQKRKEAQEMYLQKEREKSEELRKQGLMKQQQQVEQQQRVLLPPGARAVCSGKAAVCGELRRRAALEQRLHRGRVPVHTRFHQRRGVAALRVRVVRIRALRQRLLHAVQIAHAHRREEHPPSLHERCRALFLLR